MDDAGMNRLSDPNWEPSLFPDLADERVLKAVTSLNAPAREVPKVWKEGKVRSTVKQKEPVLSED